MLVTIGNLKSGDILVGGGSTITVDSVENLAGALTIIDFTDGTSTAPMPSNLTVCKLEN